MRIHPVAVFASCCVVSIVSSACNKRVFRFVEPSCDRTIPVDVSIPLRREADILIVVDNSGSMFEEQQNLADNFINLRCDDEDDPSTCECPLQDLTAIPEEFRNPAPGLYEGDGPLSKCGFIQLLAAFENDFRVGVITTDVSPCDNRFGGLGPDFRPQRGCLQPDGPSRENTRLVLKAEDLQSNDPAVNNLAARFSSTLANIGTRGSGFERGLDAMEIFLDAQSDRAPECTEDLAAFRREGAQLVTIFLTDEEDCSHGDGELGFLDENEELECGSNIATAQSSDASRCYPKAGESSVAGLAPVDRYVAALRRADADAKIAVIAGLVNDGDELVASSCSPAQAVDAPPLLDCWESHGQSNLNGIGNPDVVGDGQVCSTDPTPAQQALRDGRDCCLADRGDRYVELAAQVSAGDAARSTLLDSICTTSFRRTMINIAAIIGATNFVDLVEEPAGGVLVVTQVKAGETKEVVVKRLDSLAACEEESGFVLDGKRVLFCNDAVPQPGDDVHIRAKGEANTPECEALDAASAD
jgi:hypothetical protein